ncbi:MAG: pyruvate kinase [Longimicrobiales bacterium]|nr:pyruvate kinase [Longimicrobiales bacterium]
MKEHLRTKVVATLGPATASLETIRSILETGANVVRINFAHGTADDHRQTVAWVREAAEALDVPVAILGDLAGPKIRIGELAEPVELQPDQVVVIAPEDEAEGDELPCTYDDLADDVSRDTRILLDDGQLELRVQGKKGMRVEARVVRGGMLRSNKGLNLPGVQVSAPALTEKDRSDLQLAIELDVDYIGLSFVQRPEDITQLRELIPEELLIVAKIEKDVAVERIQEILDVTDAVMVARGDLGVELPFEQVPVVQKKIIQMANMYARPVITATQMLESMIEAARPTRAEASDVANALFDGTGAVMLSGETAVGRNPVVAVDAMVRIGREIENTASFVEGPKYDVPMHNWLRTGATRTEHAIAAATVEAVNLLGAPAIITLTRSGFTSRLVASYRPRVPILGLCHHEKVYRQLALVWGVTPFLCADVPEEDYDEVVGAGLQALLDLEMAQLGDRVVVTAGIPFAVSGTTNMVRVEEL